MSLSCKGRTCDAPFSVNLSCRNFTAPNFVLQPYLFVAVDEFQKRIGGEDTNGCGGENEWIVGFTGEGR